MSNRPMRFYSSQFKEKSVGRSESGEALATVWKGLGIVRKLLPGRFCMHGAGRRGGTERRG